MSRLLAPEEPRQQSWWTYCKRSAQVVPRWPPRWRWRPKHRPVRLQMRWQRSRTRERRVRRRGQPRLRSGRRLATHSRVHHLQMGSPGAPPSSEPAPRAVPRASHLHAPSCHASAPMGAAARPRVELLARLCSFFLTFGAPRHIWFRLQSAESEPRSSRQGPRALDPALGARPCSSERFDL